MYIKHLVGPRKGEIEDVEFEGAKAKIENGEAEDVYNGMPGNYPRPIVSILPQVMNTRAESIEINSKRKRR